MRACMLSRCSYQRSVSESERVIARGRGYKSQLPLKGVRRILLADAVRRFISVRESRAPYWHALAHTQSHALMQVHAHTHMPADVRM
jgi:hypothetical protein